MVLRKSLSLYVRNFPIIIAFAVLLVFVLVFLQFSNVFISSGSLFLDYGFLKANPIIILGELLLVAIFLAVYSTLVTAVVFGARKDLGGVRFQYYLKEMLEKFAVQLFAFYLLFTIILALLAALLLGVGISATFVNVVLFLVAIAFIFVPQTIVVDEKKVLQSISYTLNFVKDHPVSFLYAIAISAVLLAIVPLIELFFDQYNYAGGFVALAILALFVLPFIEIVKTQVYMTKFGLVKGRSDFEEKFGI
ncbi:MAG: hypothetical protein V1847_02025 [Candidatus Diapherotrites archaeon]